MATETQWCVLLWDGPNLYGVFGPFPSREAAKAWVDPNGDLRDDVVPLYDPDSEEATP